MIDADSGDGSDPSGLDPGESPPPELDYLAAEAAARVVSSQVTGPAPDAPRPLEAASLSRLIETQRSGESLTPDKAAFHVLWDATLPAAD